MGLGTVVNFTLAPEGAGTHLTWEVEVEPDDLLPLFAGTYEQAVAAIKKQFES